MISLCLCSSQGLTSSEVDELRHEDFEQILELGRGNSGAVFKVVHKPTNILLARKVAIRCLGVSLPLIDLAADLSGNQAEPP